MKSLMFLWREAADDLAAWCSTSAADDYKKLVRRVEAEGVSFLTLTLPAYARDFEQALDGGSVAPYHFRSFRRKGGLPLFLGGFLVRVFDSGGVLLDEPCKDSIFAIRQLTLMFKKIELPCSDARNARAVKRFVECEQELSEWTSSPAYEELLPHFSKAATLLWAGRLQPIENLLAREDPLDGLWPKHGPGATAEGIRGNAKFRQLEWPSRLERVFPYGEYALPSGRENAHIDRVQFLEPGEERPVRVVLVPKTLSAPRIIAIEPVCMQYMQQAVADAVIQETDDTFDVRRRLYDGKHFVSSFIGFDDQDPNRELARKGSRDGSLATLDLSEASDRVQNRHVELLFNRQPRILEAVQATRSSKADVPGFGVIPLAKFASMGSALCFPVEAMVFATIVFAAISTKLSSPLTREVINSFRGQVRVYGDDIIVPVDYVGPVIHALEAFGLKVNMDKSFWTGKFRESCGGEYYDGDWVTPVKVRRLFPRKRADVEEIISLVSLRNQFYWAGMWKTAGWLDHRITSVLNGHFPVVEPTSPVLGRESVLPYRAERFHPHLHSPLVQGYVVRSVIPSSPLEDEWALLKCLLKRGTEPFADPRHLERQGRPEAVGIKLRGASPF